MLNVKENPPDIRPQGVDQFFFYDFLMIFQCPNFSDSGADLPHISRELTHQSTTYRPIENRPTYGSILSLDQQDRPD